MGSSHRSNVYVSGKNNKMLSIPEIMQGIGVKGRKEQKKI
jgi:hypothetical protein